MKKTVSILMVTVALIVSIVAWYQVMTASDGPRSGILKLDREVRQFHEMLNHREFDKLANQARVVEDSMYKYGITKPGSEVWFAIPGPASNSDKDFYHVSLALGEIGWGPMDWQDGQADSLKEMYKLGMRDATLIDCIPLMGISWVLNRYGLLMLLGTFIWVIPLAMLRKR